MAESDALFVGSVPAIYDRLLVPLIFEPYAADLAARLAVLEPGEVLEIAAGTGVATRAAAQALPGALIVATDLNQAMLDQAMSRHPVRDRITWRQAPADALPFDDESFDAVICQFGVMFFPDKIPAYREVRRVLRHGGSFLFIVWDRLDENDFAYAITEALAAVFPDDPPRFLERVPYGYHDVQKIHEELRAAGFSRADVLTIRHQSASPAVEPAVIAYCQGTPLRSEIEARGRVDEVTRAVTHALECRFGSGPIEGRIQAHLVTAT